MRVITSSDIDGTIVAPPSKSGMIRAIASSLLAAGISEILNPSFCDDGMASLGIAESLGADITIRPDRVLVNGCGGLRADRIRDRIVDCHESGLCMRMFASIAALADEEIVLEGKGSLLGRPMHLEGVLRSLGAECSMHNGLAPVTVKGPIAGGELVFDDAHSSQSLTGLLMALPLCSGDSVIEAPRLSSKPYIALTMSILNRFGITISHDRDMKSFFVRGGQQYRPCTYAVEGDWSGASFMLVAGAIGGSITVKGLNRESCQADRAVMNALEAAGATTRFDNDSVAVHRKDLKAFQFDATDCPDLFPPLIALAAHCEGKSTIYGARRLIHKESNRALALASEFAKLGVEIELYEERIDVRGSQIKDALIETHNDHRIAMACAVAGIEGKGEVVIDRPECVFKSYPNFFEDLDSVRGIHE